MQLLWDSTLQNKWWKYVWSKACCWYLYRLIFKVKSGQSYPRPGFVTHQKESRANCISIWFYNGCEDLISCRGRTVQHVKVREAFTDLRRPHWPNPRPVGTAISSTSLDSRVHHTCSACTCLQRCRCWCSMAINNHWLAAGTDPTCRHQAPKKPVFFY